MMKRFFSEGWRILPETSWVTLWAFLFLLGFQPLARAGQPIPKYQTSLIKDLSKKKSYEEFSCRDNVIVYFDWENLPNGQHKITAIWVNPDGEEENSFDINFTAGGKRISNWINLNFTNLEKKVGIFSSDTSRGRLNGKWQVKLFLDGEFLETKFFEIVCD